MSKEKNPNLGTEYFGEIRFEVEFETERGTRKSETTNEKTEEHYVREGCCEIDNLRMELN